MRDMLAKSLEVLIWLATAFFIIMSCYTGAMIIRFSGDGSLIEVVLGGFLTIVFGVTMSFVFAGICFQIMDIRMFTKHMAMSLKRQQNR
ncbi:MAG: hypothetical protein AAFR93_08205 [Pseudomonadota bacterium]